MYILLGVNIICMSINPSRPTITCRSVYHVFRAIALCLQFLIIGADYWRYRLPMDTLLLLLCPTHTQITLLSFQTLFCTGPKPWNLPPNSFRLVYSLLSFRSYEMFSCLLAWIQFCFVSSSTCSSHWKLWQCCRAMLQWFFKVVLNFPPFLLNTESCVVEA